MSLAHLDLDDLGSFDGSDGVAKTPTPPQSPQAPYYNPVGSNIGAGTGADTGAGPARSLASSETGAYDERAQSHAVNTVNAVHMHVQENAKVPLLNQPVDRTNSSHPSYPSARITTDGAIDPAGFSMAELFLSKESKHRQSRNMSYEGLGSLFEDTGLGAARRPSAGGSSTGSAPTAKTAPAAAAAAATGATADEDTQTEIDALTAAIDPTPWSEIERKMHTDHEKAVSRPAAQAQTQTQAPAPPTVHPQHYSYYAYGRQYQLPIPERVPSPPRGPPATSQVPPSSADIATNSSEPPVFAQALATAAALASVGRPTPRTAPPPSTGRLLGPSAPTPTSSSAPPYTKAQQTMSSDKKTAATGRHFQLNRATYAPPQHAANHSASRASVLAAANKKSQYGFGGNHVVPSVPAPPPSTTGNNHVQNKAALSLKRPLGPPLMPPIPPIPNFHHDPLGANSAGAAYERKKQRAKDARIKLNDAIERLSIAMSLAGSQSKQRIYLLNSRISRTEQRPKSLQIHDECVNLVESAKKWDRPSFIGTAASLVQALNSQCESLSREMMCLQDRLDAALGTTSGVPGSVPLLLVTNGNSETSNPEHKRQERPADSIDEGSPAKRMRGSGGEMETCNNRDVQHVDVSADQETLFGKVAAMLDPVSLSRCPCVSRSWRDMKAFTIDNVWVQLAVKRFGFFNVRQWIEKMEDEDSDDGSIAKKSIYRAMNAANVAPHFQQEGLSLLGDAKIPGRISGWVYMVERSNGETLRSVKRDPQSVSASTGSYQSRPVVELRLVIQNTGMSNHPIAIKNQQISVDVSTRRSGGELKEITWDDRFLKVVTNLDGSRHRGKGEQSRYDIQGELCRLTLYEATIVDIHIDARGCSTTSKFQQRSNFTKILVSLEGTTVPMVIPFLRDGTHGGR